MALRGRLSSLVKQFTGPSAAPTPWRPLGQPYPLLSTFDPTPLNTVPGLVAIWHLGVRPQWLKVVAVQSLGAAIVHAQEIPEIMSYRPNGDVYVAWAPQAQPAHARHVIDALRPLLTLKLATEIENLGDNVADFPLPPGTGS